jgi:DNA (cytosine-5)-methyltransferase 1
VGFLVLKRVYSIEGTSPTIPTCCGGNHEPKILEDFYANRELREYEEAFPTLRAARQRLKVIENSFVAQDIQYRIRKLTPKECWRLMGFDDSDFEICEQMYI